MSDDEIARLAVLLRISEFDFIQKFTRLRADRQGLSLNEKANGECVFLDRNDCAVQEVKPRQCREFPNLWNFPGFEKVCHAIPRRVTEQEFKALVAKATGEESPRLESRDLIP